MKAYNLANIQSWMKWLLPTYFVSSYPSITRPSIHETSFAAPQLFFPAPASVTWRELKRRDMKIHKPLITNVPEQSGEKPGPWLGGSSIDCGALQPEKVITDCGGPLGSKTPISLHGASGLQVPPAAESCQVSLRKQKQTKSGHVILCVHCTKELRGKCVYSRILKWGRGKEAVNWAIQSCRLFQGTTEKVWEFLCLFIKRKRSLYWYSNWKDLTSHQITWWHLWTTISAHPVGLNSNWVRCLADTLVAGQVQDKFWAIIIWCKFPVG